MQPLVNKKCALSGETRLLRHNNSGFHSHVQLAAVQGLIIVV